MNPSVTPIKKKWHNRDEFLTGANISDVALSPPSCWAILNLDRSDGKRPCKPAVFEAIRKHTALRRLVNHGKWSSTGLILCRFQILNYLTGVSERHFHELVPRQGSCRSSIPNVVCRAFNPFKPKKYCPRFRNHDYLFIHFFFEKSPNPLFRYHNTEWGSSKPLDMLDPVVQQTVLVAP